MIYKIQDDLKVITLNLHKISYISSMFKLNDYYSFQIFFDYYSQELFFHKESEAKDKLKELNSVWYSVLNGKGI